MQTDKAIYKPSDTINFRVLALDSNLKPSLIKNKVQVYITVRTLTLLFYKHEN